MATLVITANPAMVSLPNTSENVIVFDPSLVQGVSSPTTAIIEIVTGTVNFNTQGQPAANGASYTTAGTKFPLTFRFTDGISVKATTAGDSFKISF